MTKIIVAVFLSLFMASNLYGAQSSIVDSEGYACMGEDKSRRQTEQAAVSDAKRKAIENVSTYVKSETHVKDFELEKDIVSAYANATVKIIQEIEKGWYKDPDSGDCYKIKIKAEVIPDEKEMEKIAKRPIIDEPSAPLTVQVWTDKKEYKEKETIKVYIKGNKPFYARVIYKDAGNNMIQLLPNPYRQDNYFNGGVIYEIPSGNDRFVLEVTPPFGSEGIIVYGSTSQLGDISLRPAGGVYEIKTLPSNIGQGTRSIALKPKNSGQIETSAEFVEAEAILKTTK